MATQEERKVKVKNLREFLNRRRSPVQKNTDAEDKDKALFMKTERDFKELLNKEIPESELLQKGKTMVIRLKQSNNFEKLPQTFKEKILYAFPEEDTVHQKQGDGKKHQTPSSGQDSNTENQNVDVGSAPVQTPSIQLPSTTSTQRPGQKAETENHQEKIATLEKKLENELEKSKDLLHKFNDRGDQIIGLENENKRKDEKINGLEAEAKHLAESLEEEKTIRTKVENELKSAREMANRLEKDNNNHFVEGEKYKKRIAEFKVEYKNLEAAYTDLEKKKYRMEQQAHKNIEQMQAIIKEEKRKSDEEYKKLLADRDDLRDRFSKLAGKKLQEQNADIADLSDPNRAMKVSEKFGQLYDDEWTNAFESLTDKKLGVQLKDAINILLRLLQECWTFCNKLMATQMESLQSVFLHPAQNLANFDQKKTGLTDRPRITSKDQPSLYDLRKRVGVSPPVIEEVKQALLADSKTWDKREKKEFDKKHIEACTPYLQKCAEICWLMALHDPPLLMKIDVKQGEKFDTNIYTVYSQSGQTIDFLVWPPLYNGKDGGLLSKGVAEPVKVVSKKK